MNSEVEVLENLETEEIEKEIKAELSWAFLELQCLAKDN